MTKCIAFHSYKGGTGKTTIAANFGALLAKKGYNVYLLDLDVYAPSLGSYFDIYEPKKWINDFLLGNASVDDVCMDITKRISDDMKGTLNVGFANSSKEEIYKLEGNVSKQSSQMQLLRNFILLREELFVKKNADFVIIDTSPGIRYWSINTLAVSDIVILTLKMGDLDIEGTKKMAQEIYKLEGNVSRQSSQMQLLRNFILLREELFVKKNADFVIIDTSPGIRYWSINTLAVSDIVILTLKMGDLDIEGTKKNGSRDLRRIHQIWNFMLFIVK
jgi:cellulose biosynthesis protein BcsQ